MGGVRHARTIKRMPEPQQWSLDMITDIVATPWSVHETSETEVIHHKSQTEAPTVDTPAQVRRIYIEQADLEQFSDTKGCKRCQHILVNGPNKGTMPHTDACRARITAALEQTAW